MTRVNVDFSSQAYQALQDIAAQHRTTMSEALRSAISLKVWYEGERAAGNRILIEHPDGKVREVVGFES